MYISSIKNRGAFTALAASIVLLGLSTKTRSGLGSFKLIQIEVGI